MSLGSMITKARKDAGLSIDDLSAATNIRGPLLKQMESDNFTQCGGETYARGHLRNMATKLNVDPQLFLTAFEDEQMHVDRSMQDLLVENSVMREPGESRKVSWKVLVAISISTLSQCSLYVHAHTFLHHIVRSYLTPFVLTVDRGYLWLQKDHRC